MHDLPPHIFGSLTSEPTVLAEGPVLPLSNPHEHIPEARVLGDLRLPVCADSALVERLLDDIMLVLRR